MNEKNPEQTQVNYYDSAYRIPSNGAELYVEQVGPSNAPVVFYLHSGPGYNSYSFRDLAGEDLQDIRMIYADQRGAGRSYAEDLRGALEPNTLADDVITIAEALELPPFTILAHGFGAQIAIKAAHTYPKYITKIILVNPWLDMPLLARTMQRHAAFMSGNSDLALPTEALIASTEISDLPDPILAVEQAVSWVAGKDLLDALQFRSLSSRMRLEHSDSEAFVTMEALGQFHIADDENLSDVSLWTLTTLDVLEQLSQQIIILLGKDDKTSYPEQGEHILSLMPQTLVSILDSSHYPWLDDPETFAQLIQDSLAV